MGETQQQSFHLSFNARLRVDFQGSRVTSFTGPCSVLNQAKLLPNGRLV